MTALAIMGLLPTGGRMHADRLRLMGEDLLRARPDRMDALRGAAMGMIFQEPMTALNPVMTVGEQIAETARRHLRVSRREARDRAIEALRRVGIAAPEQRVGDYPHHMSGGMRQRVMIAMALICRPRLLIADEPTTALDVTIQAQILDLMLDLQAEYRMGIVLISHDLGVVSAFTERVLIMYLGKVMEEARADTIFQAPRHPYTQALLDSIPQVDRPAEPPECHPRHRAIGDGPAAGVPLRAALRLRPAGLRCGTAVRSTRSGRSTAPPASATPATGFRSGLRDPVAPRGARSVQAVRSARHR